MDGKVEKDESFDETTLHASMVCKCGVRVWYGYGKQHDTRPLFCKKCTEVEIQRIERTTSLTGDELESYLGKHLRRKIHHG
jgi:hypothetical protein